MDLACQNFNITRGVSTRWSGAGRAATRVMELCPAPQERLHASWSGAGRAATRVMEHGLGPEGRLYASWGVVQGRKGGYTRHGAWSRAERAAMRYAAGCRFRQTPLSQHCSRCLSLMVAKFQSPRQVRCFAVLLRLVSIPDTRNKTRRTAHHF